MLTMKIVDRGGLPDLPYQWTAEVIAPQGTWRSPHPMPSVELNRILISMGIDGDEIYNAETKAYVEHAESTYRRLQKEYLPFLQAALAGEREVPEQEPVAEAWLAYALYCHDEIRSLWEVLFSADAVNHAIPNYDEISWAFLRLKKRGWLAVEGDMYGLTPEGYRAVKEIEDRGEPLWPVKKLEELISYVMTGQSVFSRMTWPIQKLEKWISKNPPPADK